MPVFIDKTFSEKFGCTHNILLRSCGQIEMLPQFSRGGYYTRSLYIFLLNGRIRQEIKLIAGKVEYASLAETQFRLQKMPLGSGLRFGFEFC